jgi:FG-GAP repeat
MNQIGALFPRNSAPGSTRQPAGLGLAKVEAARVRTATSTSPDASRRVTIAAAAILLWHPSPPSIDGYDVSSSPARVEVTRSAPGESVGAYPLPPQGSPKSSRERVATGCGWQRLVAAKCPRPRENSDDPGDFARTWTNLEASNTGVSEYFGQSVALSGDTLAVGAMGESSTAQGVNGNQADNGALDSGAVYIFH